MVEQDEQVEMVKHINKKWVRLNQFGSNNLWVKMVEIVKTV